MASLARRESQPQNCLMRPLAALLVVAAMLLGIYYFFLKKMPTTDEGTAPTQAISLTGVRNDLLQIAQAERGFIAQNGRCAALEELVSAGAISMARPGRDGYEYSIDCSSSDVTVTARHAPAPADSPIRYPNFAIDQTMQIHEIN